MEDWKIVIVAYCGVAVMWCLYMLFRHHKLQKSRDFSSMKKIFFVFLVVLLLVIGAMVAHLYYLMGSFILGWPILVVIGLMICCLLSGSAHSIRTKPTRKP